MKIEIDGIVYPVPLEVAELVINISKERDAAIHLLQTAGSSRQWADAAQALVDARYPPPTGHYLTH